MYLDFGMCVFVLSGAVDPTPTLFATKKDNTFMSVSMMNLLCSARVYNCFDSLLTVGAGLLL